MQVTGLKAQQPTEFLLNLSQAVLQWLLSIPLLLNRRFQIVLLFQVIRSIHSTAGFIIISQVEIPDLISRNSAIQHVPPALGWTQIPLAPTPTVVLPTRQRPLPLYLMRREFG